MHEKRTRIWIDRFQTLLFFRIAFYFIFYQLAVFSLVSIEANCRTKLVDMVGSSAASRFVWVTIGVVVLVGILFIYDAIRFTHRIVGPLVRFRHVCRAIRDGDPVPLVRLRKGDLLDEFRDEFNAMLKALEERGALVLKETEEQRAKATPVETVASR